MHRPPRRTCVRLCLNETPIPRRPVATVVELRLNKAPVPTAQIPAAPKPAAPKPAAPIPAAPRPAAGQESSLPESSRAVSICVVSPGAVRKLQHRCQRFCESLAQGVPDLRAANPWVWRRCDPGFRSSFGQGPVEIGRDAGLGALFLVEGRLQRPWK